MALRNLVFVVDVDRGEQKKDELERRNGVLKRGMLQILLRLGFRYGLDKVRWGYKFFNSRSSRCSALISRDFKELQHKAFQDFELELDLKMEESASQRKALNCPPAASVQNAIKETLLDFQWDRPDITSPTKPSGRAARTTARGRGGRSSASSHTEDGASDGGRNLLFVVSECPRSGAHMEQYLSPAAGGATELLPHSLQEMMRQREVTLHWMDTASHEQVVSCVDHSGADRLVHLLSPLGGRLLPLSSLLDLINSGSELSPWFSSVWFFLLSSEPSHRLCFPLSVAAFTWEQEGSVERCVLQVEPVSSSQKPLSSSAEVQLKAVIQDLTTEQSQDLFKSGSEVWVVHSSDQNRFREILLELKNKRLRMFAEVCEEGLTRPALLSPLSLSSALLALLPPTPSVLCPLVDRALLCSPEPLRQPLHEPQELPDVVSSVLGVVYDIMEQDEEQERERTPELSPVPDWAQQELGHTLFRGGCVQSWFPQSDGSGVSANLMENIRLLHAVPEDACGGSCDAEQEFLTDLNELYQSSTGHKRHKRGAQRTPVKHKMKTMSRSLQMLNAARLNVKAQKSQPDSEPYAAEKPKRRFGDKEKNEENAFSFSSEAGLLQFLKETRSKMVLDQSLSLSSGLQLLLSALKVYAGKDAEVKQCELLQTLLDSSKNIRLQFSADTDQKIRECELQSLLRLETCRLVTSVECDAVDAEQMAEEVAEMLRIISLTKDPVFLTRFLQDHVLVPLFLSTIPRVLADVYHCLGTQLPECLAAVLPSDFFSDESVTKDSASEGAESSSAATESGEGLQELRERSAAKRRSGMLTRHRSLTESSQRQIQVQLPKKRGAATTRPGVTSAKPSKPPAAQEVTRVRRNLFTRETPSPSKRNKLPRSRSVSALEGLKRKRSSDADDHHKLLTKKVCETPLHKQVSSRLLLRQRMGRRSYPTDQVIVEESPLKPTEDLRRSPRLKHFSRRHSFYSSSQPRSRALDSALSSSQPSLRFASLSSALNVRSPIRLLFGAAQSPHRPSQEQSGASRTRLCASASVFESPNRTPPKSPGQRGPFGNTTPKTPTESPGRRGPFGNTTPKTPTESPGRRGPFGNTTPKTPTESPGRRGPFGNTTPKTPTESPGRRGPFGNTTPKTPTESLGRRGPFRNTTPKTPTESLGRRGPFRNTTPKTPTESLGRRGPFRNTTPKTPRTPPASGPRSCHCPALDAPNGPFKSPGAKDSPLRSILKTPVKNATATPKKSVTWSPSPQTFKVPESPKVTTFRVRTPDRLEVEVLKTPDKLPMDVFGCQVSLVKLDGISADRMGDRQLETPPSQKKNVRFSPTSQKATCSARSLTYETPTLIYEKANPDGGRPLRLTRANSSWPLDKNASPNQKIQDTEKSPRSRRTDAEMSKPNPEVEFSPESSPETRLLSKTRKALCLKFGTEVGNRRTTRRNPKPTRAPEDFHISRRNLRARSSESIGGVCESSEKRPKCSKSNDAVTAERNLDPVDDLCPEESDLQNNEADFTGEATRKSATSRSKFGQEVEDLEPEKQKVTKQKIRSNEKICADLNQKVERFQEAKTPLVKRQKSRTGSNDGISNEEPEALVPVKSQNLRKRKTDSSVLQETSETLSAEVSTSSNNTENRQKSEYSIPNVNSQNSEDSLDIVTASVVKAHGLKMNISFSRKPSTTGDELLADTSSPKRLKVAPSRSYGFRQTPDRRQREAAVRLGYANDFPPRLSTPRATARRDGCSTYQVEMEMQSSGLPRLKIKRTDSDLGRRSRVEGGGCVSPAVCSHRTPAKGNKPTQTFICQSYTPTRVQMSPGATPDTVALTPSPQSAGKVTPDYLNSWPRKKRVRVQDQGPGKDRRADQQMEGAVKERCSADQDHVGALESELGVSLLQDAEEEQNTDLMWMDKMEDDVFWSGDTGAGQTPPSSRKRNAITASGILALTNSPLLFKTRTPGAKGESKFDPDLSPFGKPIRRSTTKTYSRKKLLP